MKNIYINEKTFIPNLATNEIESHGIIYSRGKPNSESIEQLKIIKELRLSNMLKDSDYDLADKKELVLKQELSQVGNLRAENRQKKIEEISNMFIEIMKRDGKRDFTRESINSYLNGMSERQRERIVKSLIEFMKNAGIIQESRNIKTIYFFENKPIGSNDFDSYSLLMKRNGYHTEYSKYEFDEESRFPKKIKIGRSEINQIIPELLEECDLIENKSGISVSSQGCYSFGNKSVARRSMKYSIISYELIV